MNTQGRLSHPITLPMTARIAATPSNAIVATVRVFMGWLLNQGSPSPAPTARDVAMRDDDVGAVHLPVPAFTARRTHGPGQKENAIYAGKKIRLPPGARADLRADSFPRTIRLPPTGSAHAMIVRIHTGNDGQTHFEDIPLPANQSVALPPPDHLVIRS